MTALALLLVAIVTQSPANFGKVNVCERVWGTRLPARSADA